jgi:hypothetical protein
VRQAGVSERWVRPPVVAREAPPAWRSRWRFRLAALLLLALVLAGGVQLFRVLSGATAQDPGIGSEPAAPVGLGTVGPEAGPGAPTAK